MATWTYEAIWGLANNAGIPKDRSSIPFTLKRTSPASVDTSLYKLANTTGTFSSDSTVKTYTSFKLNFGGYGTSASISSNSAQHAISGNMTGVSSNILNVGTSGTSISISIDGKSSDSYNYIYCYGTKFTFTVEVTEKYQMSTIGASNVSFGDNSTVNISNPNLSELNHSVTWTIEGNGHTYSGYKTPSAGVSSATCLIDSAWMDAVPYATSIQCKIEVITKKGSTIIGTSTVTYITVSVPSNIKPTIGSLTAAVMNPVSGFSGRYIQNKTGVTLTVNNASPGTGSTIPSTGYNIRMTKSETTSFDFLHSRYTISTLRNSGSITFYVSITDSRGRISNEVSATINVDAYAVPSVDSASAYRVNASGVADENGTYANISITASYAAISGNSLTINSQYYVSTAPGTKYTAQNNMVSGTTYKIGNNSLSPSSTYYVVFTLTDTVGSSESVTVMVQTSAYAIHVKNGGMGVAFGKTSEQQNAVEINPGWNLYYKGHVTCPVIYSATEPSSNLTVGLVWIKPKT